MQSTTAPTDAQKRPGSLEERAASGQHASSSTFPGFHPSWDAITVPADKPGAAAPSTSSDTASSGHATPLHSRTPSCESVRAPHLGRHRLSPPRHKPPEHTPPIKPFRRPVSAKVSATTAAEASSTDSTPRQPAAGQLGQIVRDGRPALTSSARFNASKRPGSAPVAGNNGRAKPVTSEAANAAAAEQLHALEDKFASLRESRRRLIDSTQALLKRNRTALQALKQDNKELQARFAAAAPKRQGAKSQIEREIEALERQAAGLRRDHDRLVRERQQAHTKLAQLQDGIKELQQAQEWARQDTPELQHIRELEASLDQALIRLNEASGIQATYEQIAERMRTERLGFGCKLQALEDTLAAKHADLHDLQRLSAESNQAREAARAALQAEEASAAIERAQRAQQLQKQRALVKARQGIFRELAQHETKRQDEHAELEGDLSAAEEEAIQARNAGQMWMAASLRRQQSRSAMQVASCEDAMRHIREATGVHDISEVVQKFLSHDAAQAGLEGLFADANARLEALTARRSELQQLAEAERLAEHPPAGVRDLELESESALTELGMQGERLAAQHARITHTLVDVKAGMEHLAGMLGLRDCLPVNDDNLLEVIDDCEQRLVQLWEAIQSDVAAMAALEAAQTSALHESLPKASPVRRNLSVMPAVSAAERPHPGSATSSDTSDMMASDDEEAVPDRAQLKQLSSRRASADGSQTSRSSRRASLAGQLAATSQHGAACQAELAVTVLAELRDSEDEGYVAGTPAQPPAEQQAELATAFPADRQASDSEAHEVESPTPHLAEQHVQLATSGLDELHLTHPTTSQSSSPIDGTYATGSQEQHDLDPRLVDDSAVEPEAA